MTGANIYIGKRRSAFAGKMQSMQAIRTEKKERKVKRVGRRKGKINMADVQ